MKRRLLEWLPAATWMGFIFALSSQTSLPGPANYVADFALKKTLHVVAYSILALLLLFANRRHRRPHLIAFILAALYAVSDEFHQSLVPYREGTLRDIAIDSFAAAIVLLLVRWRPFRSIVLDAPFERSVINSIWRRGK